MSVGESTQLVVITGLSGSGKSTVAKCFEDLNYYTVDNLPLPLLREFLAQPGELAGGHQAIAVVTDVRAPGFSDEMPDLLREVEAQSGTECTVLFLEASDETLLRRFSETRRPHPLSDGKRVIDGIERERDLLAEIRGMADMVFDTSEWSIHEIRAEVYRRFGSERGHAPRLSIAIVSFGFKHGIPYGSDTLFDVRFLANPHFVPDLRELSGREPPVIEFLERQSDYPELVERLAELLLYLLPQYRAENRSHLSIGIGCTGGKHRSVAVAEALGARLHDAGWPVQLEHRDIAK
ncbi:MAG: RNase adapter RapZ [Thermoanaerobaculia bacterium]|nr:RNase adapter RapZ [Thermoanaerobaculia bacterium]